MLSAIEESGLLATAPRKSILDRQGLLLHDITLLSGVISYRLCMRSLRYTYTELRVIPLAVIMSFLTLLSSCLGSTLCLKCHFSLYASSPNQLIFQNVE